MNGAGEIRFDGRAAIVTGAAGAMGRAYALELARRGAAILVNDYGGGVHGEQDGSAVAAKAVAGEIRAFGGRATADAHAVGSGAAARAIVAAAIAAFGRVDILINNAGVALPGAITAHEDDAIERHYAINLIGVHHLMRAAWPIMSAQRYGRILNISSNGALGVGGNAPYGAAKAGLIGLSLDAALEGRRKGILVNTVMPTSYSRMIEEIPDRATVLWFKRYLRPEKVATAMAYFLSEESHVTGRILFTGGGRLGTVVFAEGGEMYDPDMTAEVVRARLAEVLNDDALTPVHDQATAGARYIRYMPWEGDVQPDFGPDLEEKDVLF